MMKTKLLDFQETAYNKLKGLKIGALYMEMGLGKTRTTLELIQYRLNKKKIERVLWLCPCSTKQNLKDQIEEHSDLIDFIDIYGIETMSQSDRTYLEVYEKVQKHKYMLIVDESNLIKNFFAKRSERIREIAIFCKYKIILNGTPVTRNEADLFNQWYTLDWRVLGYRSYYSFCKNHLILDEKTNRVKEVKNTEYLTNRISPYSYQAYKKEVLHLPDKKFERYYFELTKEQQKEYYIDRDILIQKLEAAEDHQVSIIIYKLFTALQLVLSGRKINTFEYLQHEPFFKDPNDNPRIKKLLEVIKKFNQDEKIIIWCKYTQEIKDIESVLKEQYGVGSTALFYGDISLKERNKEIERFKTDARFLIGNKASGGYGLNLQFCSTMIFYSNDFDWGTRAQAEDRIHRIGQNIEPLYIDIIAADTLDERIISNLGRKESLAAALKRLLKRKNKNIKAWIDGGDAYGKKKRICHDRRSDGSRQKIPGK